MSRFVVINEAGRRGESAQPESTAINHPGEKAGEPRHTPCATCVRRLTSDPKSQDQPCYSHTGRNATKCFQCSSKKSPCRELPSDAVAFGREFQKATIKRYQGQVVNDWKNLGEKTLGAIYMAKQQQRQRVRQGLAGIAPITGPESRIEDDTSEHGQSQVDSEECMPSVHEQLQQPQPPRQEEPAQLNSKFQPPIQDMASRQDLQDLRAQILHDVQQTLGESRQSQSQRQDESRDQDFAPPTLPAGERPTERNSLHETVRDIIDSAQRSREGVATIVIHFH